MKKKKQRKTTKVAVKTETVRSLSEKNLEVVAGAATVATQGFNTARCQCAASYQV